MPIAVRRAGPGDVAVIVEYNRRLAAETEGKTLDAAVLRAGVEAGLAEENKALYFVAEDGGDVVGQLMLTREWSDWRNGWMWWIQSVYVRADARRRGTFRALYQHVLESAQADPGVIGLRLYVEHANGPAQQTYERLGMARTGYLVFERCPL
jgi:ribosomal protein S18 acetylase RimI-like enzyme